MTKRCLYLVSSSSSKEYVADCLEALALPRGTIHHFRYLARYLDDSLRDELASAPGRLPKDLKDMPVVVVYVYQEQTTIGSWKPTPQTDGSHLPLRCGRLVEAYREGDVAHFFFEITDYVKPKVSRSTARKLLNAKVKFRVSRNRGAKASYAHLASNLQLGAKQSQDALAFQEFVSTAYRPSEWRTRSLGSVPLDVTYAVVFVRIAGLYLERNDDLIRVAPTFRPLRGNPVAEYRLQSGETYHVKVITRMGTRLAAELPGQGDALLRLQFDTNLLKPASATSFRISSNYDLQFWSFVPRVTEERRTILSIACDHTAVVDRTEFVRKELICPAVSIPLALLPDGAR